MSDETANELHILRSWQHNATAWTAAVRGQQIASRRHVTDQAIINAALDYTPRSVLDAGCGEGWLARQLSARGIRVTGVDATAALIDAARETGSGDFHQLTYQQLSSGVLQLNVDAVICNFSLLGKESVDRLIGSLHTLLNRNGVLLLQTLHPHSSCGDLPYQDGWREGAWNGFSDDFSDPAPWYFRTLQSWIALLQSSGLQLRELREPGLPGQPPLSALLIAQHRA